jgi:phage protein U
MFTGRSVIFIDGKNNNDDGMFTGKKCNNEESSNDGKKGKHKFRRRREWGLKLRRVNE